MAPDFPAGTTVSRPPRWSPGDPFTLASQVVVGGVIEAAVNECTKQMAQRMRALKVPHKVLFRPDGTHSWGYWERDLKTTWPMIANDLK